MVNYLNKYHRYLLQTMIILALALGIAGLGISKTALLACEPDCPMHQTNMQDMSCCEGSGANQAKMTAGGNQQENHPLSPCCDGTSCIDSSFEAQAVVPSISPSKDTAAPAFHVLSANRTFFLFPEKTSSQLQCLEGKTPIYMVTCTYLI